MSSTKAATEGGYPIVFSNTSTKSSSVKGVLFAAADDDQGANADPSCVWAVFDSRNMSLVIPESTHIMVEYFDASGDKVTMGPYDCTEQRSWMLHTVDSASQSVQDQLNEAPSVAKNETAAMPSYVLEHSLNKSNDATAVNTRDVTIDLSAAMKLEGRVLLLKGDRLFLMKTLKGPEMKIPISPSLYFGLTAKDGISNGDTFTNRKLFSSLAKIDRNFYNTGMLIEVTDSPAKKPSVTIQKLV